LSGVEQMYRQINLRPGCASSTNAPANNPDAAGNGKNVFFVHGYNVTSSSGRGWNAEMFKRLHWAGSRTRYWAVHWEGDLGWPNAFNYHRNVANALAIASNLAAVINSIPGDKTVLAQSLGCMVAASAIEDHDMSVGKFLMLNAAVASETFDDSLQQASPDNIAFVPADWRDYPSETWSACWHAHFPQDDRGKLRWRDRFAGVSARTALYNFYSSGDEVFEVAADVPGMFDYAVRLDWPVIDGNFPYIHFGETIQINMERHSWQKQEVLKGVNFLAGTTTGGWAFQCVYTNDTWEVAYSPAQATNLVATGMITNQPVFKRSPPEMMQSAIPSSTRNQIIASAIPALSGAAGKTDMDAQVMDDWDMNTLGKPDGGAWGRDGYPYYRRWLHNDIRNMAYLYTHKLFYELVELGGMQ
ncbi:MAG: hypothetical protein GX590_06795, partial [Lentisphaerae bacterium]|nr:hypothetical protein [Lentisphaerota bacterium]